MADPTPQLISRRTALKTLVAATGAAALATLPEGWKTPVVEVGTLPVHAQTSLRYYLQLSASSRGGSLGPIEGFISNITGTLSSTPGDRRREDASGAGITGTMSLSVTSGGGLFHTNPVLPINATTDSLGVANFGSLSVVLGQGDKKRPPDVTKVTQGHDIEFSLSFSFATPGGATTGSLGPWYYDFPV